MSNVQIAYVVNLLFCWSVSQSRLDHTGKFDVDGRIFSSVFCVPPMKTHFLQPFTDFCCCYRAMARFAFPLLSVLIIRLLSCVIYAPINVDSLSNLRGVGNATTSFPTLVERYLTKKVPVVCPSGADVVYLPAKQCKKSINCLFAGRSSFNISSCGCGCQDKACNATSFTSSTCPSGYRCDTSSCLVNASSVKPSSKNPSVVCSGKCVAISSRIFPPTWC
jgi:hypothetical protein